MRPLKDIDWNLEFYKTMKNAQGQEVDMYWLSYEFDGSAVSLGVPGGRKDVAEFVRECVKTGNIILKRLPEGVRFEPSKGFNRR